MDRGEYHRRTNQLKWRARVGWLLFFLTVFTVIGWPITYLAWTRMIRSAEKEREEVERAYEQHQQTA